MAEHRDPAARHRTIATTGWLRIRRRILALGLTGALLAIIPTASIADASPSNWPKAWTTYIANAMKLFAENRIQHTYAAHRAAPPSRSRPTPAPTTTAPEPVVSKPGGAGSATPITGGAGAVSGTPTPVPAPPAVPPGAVPRPAPSSCGGDAPAKAAGGQWQCTWSDEFTGDRLSSTWSTIPYGLGSSCLYGDPSHVTVSGGTLQLMSRRQPASSSCKYGGGGIESRNGFAQQYGRFEIRAKLPTGSGFWPAFWLLPADNTYNGEIDVLEADGGRTDAGSATLHAPAGGAGPSKSCSVGPNYSDSFHTYAVEWGPNSIRMIYDDKPCATFTGMSGSGSGGFPAAFDKPYHVLLNLAIQPLWPPDAATRFPSAMTVDYVRAWK